MRTATAMKLVIPAALVLLVCVGVSPARAEAQDPVAETPAEEPDDAEVPAEPVQEPAVPHRETVIRARQPGDDDPQQTRIERDRIETSGGQSLVGVLEREAGLYATTGSRGERLFRLRGFEQRQVFMVIDGIPAYIPYDGQLDLGKLPPDLIENVVILRGPSSLRYGPGGMGGTLSIQTRRAGRGPLLSTRFEGGRGHHYRLSSSHSNEVGPVSYILGGGAETRAYYPLSGLYTPTDSEDGAEREQSDRQLRHLFGRVRVDLDRAGWIEGTAWHVSGEWGIPPNTASSSPRYWRMSDWRATAATLAHRWIPGRGVMVQELAFVALFDNLLDAFDDDSYSTQDGPDAFHSWYHDLTAGGWLRTRIALPRRSLLRLELGARYEQHQAERESTITTDVSRVLILGAGQFESWLSPGWRAVAALQSEGEAAMEGTVEPSVDTMVAVRYEPEERPFSFGFSVGRRSRIPTLRERFSESGSGAIGRVPNHDLRPEVALHIGVDGAWQATEWLRLEITAFNAEVRDLIDRVWLDDGLDQFQNIARARLAGVEGAVELTPWSWLQIELAYQYLYARAIDETNHTGPLAYRPEHLARLGVRLRPLDWLELSTTLRLVGNQRFEDPETHFWRELGPYLAWDARVGVNAHRGIHLWLQVTNLLDANYQTKYGYHEPGWQLWGGVRVALGRRGAED